MATVLRISDFRRNPKRVFFTRGELNQLLSLYSRQVMRGEWRDYAIDQRDGTALFAVFRHSQESALYTIVKTGRGDYHLMQGRHRMASGNSLNDVLPKLYGTIMPERRALLRNSPETLA
jgi:hypothetical protein